MFTKNVKNDPLVDSVRAVMEQNEHQRRVEALVNEHFGVQSKKALPHELHAEYDAVLAESMETVSEASNLDKALGNVRDKMAKNPKLAEKIKKITKKSKEDELERQSKQYPIKAGRSVPAVKGKIEEEKEDAGGMTDSATKHKQAAMKIHLSIKAGKKSSELIEKKKKMHERMYKILTGKDISYPDSMNEGTVPRTPRERDLAAKDKNHPKGNPNKISKRDVLIARGVSIDEKASEERKAEVAKVMHKWKQGKEHIGTSEKTVPVTPKGRKQAIAIALNQAGLSKKQNMEEEMHIKSIMEEIRSNLEEELTYVYENYDEATFADYVNSLTEEQLEVLGLMEVDNPNASNPMAKPAGMTAPAPRKRVYSNPRTGPTTRSPTAADMLKRTEKAPRMDGTSSERTAGSGPGSAAYRSAANTPTYKSPQQKAAERATPTMSGGSGSVSPTAPKGGGISTERGAGMSRQQLMKRSDNPQAMFRYSGKSGTSASASQRAGAASPAPARTQQTVMGGAGQSGAAPSGGGISTLAGSGAKSMSQQRRMMDNPAALRKQPIREEESPTQIKESFESFLRNRFLRG